MTTSSEAYLNLADVGAVRQTRASLLGFHGGLEDDMCPLDPEGESSTSLAAAFPLPLPLLLSWSRSARGVSSSLDELQISSSLAPSSLGAGRLCFPAQGYKSLCNAGCTMSMSSGSGAGLQ